MREPLGINNMQEYVNQHGLRAWASEKEIFMMAHLLKIDICIYSTRFGGWQVHSGHFLDPNLQISWQKLYISHPSENHYEVVLSTQLSILGRAESSTSQKIVKAVIDDQSLHLQPSYSQVLMKTSVIDELFRQTEKMNKAEAAKNKDKELNIIRSPVKRKIKFGIATSKERKQKFRENLDDEVKSKVKADEI